MASSIQTPRIDVQYPGTLMSQEEINMILADGTPPPSPESPAVAEDNLVDWSYVHITEVIDEELDWEARERKYLQEIENLRAPKEQVTRAVQTTAQQAHGSTAAQDDAATDLGEDHEVVGQLDQRGGREENLLLAQEMVPMNY